MAHIFNVAHIHNMANMMYRPFLNVQGLPLLFFWYIPIHKYSMSLAEL